MSDIWLSTLMTETPQEGFELAVLLSRRGVKTTQPDVEVLKKMRPIYANNAPLTDSGLAGDRIELPDHRRRQRLLAQLIQLRSADWLSCIQKLFHRASQKKLCRQHWLLGISVNPPGHFARG